MAIRTSIKKTEPGFVGELVANDVYVKVSGIYGSKDSISFQAIGIANDQQIFSGSFSFAPTLEGDNFIKQAYAHLKTLPDFAGAVDC